MQCCFPCLIYLHKYEKRVSMNYSIEKDQLNSCLFRRMDIKYFINCKPSRIVHLKGWHHPLKQAVQSDRDSNSPAGTSSCRRGSTHSSRISFGPGWTETRWASGSGLLHPLSLQEGFLHQCWCTVRKRRRNWRRRPAGVTMFAVTLQVWNVCKCVTEKLHCASSNLNSRLSKNVKNAV